MDLLKIKTNKFFLFFFSLFFLFYKYPIVQLILYICLILYVLNSLHIKSKMIIDKSTISRIIFLFLWFGLFTLFAIVSKKWAIGVYRDSNTLSTLVRMLFVGTMIFTYCDNMEKAFSVIKSYIYAVFVMGLVVVVLTPISSYGIEVGENAFGSVVSLHRNTIAGAAAECILFISILRKKIEIKYAKSLMVFLLFLILISGSRGAILEMLFCVFAFVLFNVKNKKIYRNIPKVIIALFIIIILLYKVPYLNEKVLNRFASMIQSIESSSNVDGSTYSRSLMKKVAFNIFEEHPIVGAGVDGVVVYLANNPYHFGRYFRAVYSHCNYTEIAANFGIIGLLLWYLPLIKLLKNMWYGIKKNIQFSDSLKSLICMLIAMILVDNYKIPWTADIQMYSYFCIMILVFNLLNSNKETKKQ